MHAGAVNTLSSPTGEKMEATIVLRGFTPSQSSGGSAPQDEGEWFREIVQEHGIQTQRSASP